MLYLTCTMISMISSVDLAHYGISRAKDWVFMDCGVSHFAIYRTKYSSGLIINLKILNIGTGRPMQIM